MFCCPNHLRTKWFTFCCFSAARLRNAATFPSRADPCRTIQPTGRKNSPGVIMGDQYKGHPHLWNLTRTSQSTLSYWGVSGGVLNWAPITDERRAKLYAWCPGSFPSLGRRFQVKNIAPKSRSGRNFCRKS